MLYQFVREKFQIKFFILIDEDVFICAPASVPAANFYPEPCVYINYLIRSSYKHLGKPSSRSLTVMIKINASLLCLIFHQIPHAVRRETKTRLLSLQWRLGNPHKTTISKQDPHLFELLNLHLYSLHASVLIWIFVTYPNSENTVWHKTFKKQNKSVSVIELCGIPRECTNVPNKYQTIIWTHKFRLCYHRWKRNVYNN